VVKRCAALHALLFTALNTGTLAAQGHLVRSEFHAELAGSLPAQVRLRYEIRPDSTAASIPVSLLRFGGASIESLRARLAGNEIPVQLREESPAILRGEVPLGTMARSEVTLEFEYTVSVTEAGRVRLPLVAVLWPPEQARPSLFTGNVNVESRFEIYHAFPATLRSGEVNGSIRRLVFAMPVLPAVIAFDRATDPPAVTLAGALDAAVVLLTLAFCGVLWLQFRRQLPA
jgi:hypothetical protein